jgi:hypothetical protein
MSNENADLIRRAYQAYANGDLATMLRGGSASASAITQMAAHWQATTSTVRTGRWGSKRRIDLLGWPSSVRIDKAGCVDVTCSAVSFMSTSKLHERLCAPFTLRAASPPQAHQRLPAALAPQELQAAARVQAGQAMLGRHHPPQPRHVRPLAVEPRPGDQGDKSPVSREAHAGICGSRGVQLPPATRPWVPASGGLELFVAQEVPIISTAIRLSADEVGTNQRVPWAIRVLQASPLPLANRRSGTTALPSPNPRPTQAATR